MTNLSVNINKIATLRNARGGNIPDVEKVAIDCERFGADGITVHPRPDERHIRAPAMFMRCAPIIRTEFNIEGYPSEDFIDLLLKVKPEQATLVPRRTRCPYFDCRMGCRPTILISSLRWFDRLKEAGIRTSIFVGTDIENIKLCSQNGCRPYRIIYRTLCRGIPQRPSRCRGTVLWQPPRPPIRWD